MTAGSDTKSRLADPLACAEPAGCLTLPSPVGPIRFILVDSNAFLAWRDQALDATGVAATRVPDPACSGPDQPVRHSIWPRRGRQAIRPARLSAAARNRRA